MKNCVVRTFKRNDYTFPMSNLEEKLDEGWIVKFCTPILSNGETDCIEYILEKEEQIGKINIQKGENIIMTPRCCYQCYSFGQCFPKLDYKDCLDCKDNIGKLNCIREICLGYIPESQTD